MRKRIVPPVTLKGAPVPIERMEGYTDTRPRSSRPGLLASRSQVALRRDRPFERPILPAR